LKFLNDACSFSRAIAARMATARTVIESSKTSFLKMAKQPGNGFLSFPACCFRSIGQGVSRRNSQKGNSTLMAVQTFAGSMADTREFAVFGVRERAQGLRNEVGHTGNSGRVLSWVMRSSVLFQYVTTGQDLASDPLATACGVDTPLTPLFRVLVSVKEPHPCTER